MRKVIKILIGIILGLFLLWSSFRLFIDSISKGKRFESISDSIEESKACGAFICEYKLTELDSLTRQQLIKYNYLESFDSAQIWLEKGHKYENQNLYLNELIFLDKYHLIIQNPREYLERKDSTLSMRISKGETPDFGISKDYDFELVPESTSKYTSLKIRFGETSEIRNQLGANRHNFFQRISKITLQEPLSKIDVSIYLPFMTFQVDDIILSKVTLTSKGNISKTDFKDEREWWERINL
jgi:hypothetical protein